MNGRVANFILVLFILGTVTYAIAVVLVYRTRSHVVDPSPMQAIAQGRVRGAQMLGDVSRVGIWVHGVSPNDADTSQFIVWDAVRGGRFAAANLVVIEATVLDSLLKEGR